MCQKEITLSLTLHDSALLYGRFGMLGSIDANTGSPDLGWDTDQFPMDVKNSTLVMKVNMLVLSFCPLFIFRLHRNMT